MSGTLVGRRLFGSLLFGDSDYSDYSDGSSYSYSQPSAGSSSYSSGGSSDFSGGSSGYSDFSSFFSAIQSPYSTLNQGSSSAAENTDSSSIDTSVASGARSKRTEIYGKGLDNVTIMVYMCGTDLESKSAMATKDLVEMTRATLGGNVQILVYTGGCTKWNNNVVSSQYNQLYQVADGGLKCLVSNAGTGSMTNPDTLADFIQWCAENYPANRNELILWDHGGGSVSGFGYDHKYARSGSRDFASLEASGQAAWSGPRTPTARATSTVHCSLFTLHLSGPYGSEAEKGLYSHPLRFAYRTKRNEDGRKQGCGYTVGGFHGKSAKNCEFVGDKTYFSTVFPCFLQSFTVK